MTSERPGPKSPVKKVARAFSSVYVARTIAIGIAKGVNRHETLW